MKQAASIEQHTFRGEPAITLRAGELAATFVPNVGMTGVSLRYRGREHLALPGGLDALRAGRTAGLPLLAPWGNRLASRRYRAAGVDVDLRGLRLGTDDNGLPIHGLLVGKPGWRVDEQMAGGAVARLRTSIDVDARAFPFPHRIELSIVARDGTLTIDTTIIPTGRRRVPVAFGWHPYLKVPGTPRGRWRLHLPARTHLALDERGIPTGASDAEPREAAAIAQENLRRSLRARARAPARVRRRRRRRDRAALWTRLPVRAGLGAEGPHVRGAGADDRTHQRARTGHDASGRAR